MDSLVRARLAERRYVGFMGMLLPFLCWASCLITPDKPEGWSSSMSATYYFSPVLSMGLAIVATFLFTYRGYDKADRIVNRISAVASLLVAIFPCSTGFVMGRVGIFQLPVSISNIIHCTSASVLFISFIVNILMNFTKGDNKWNNLCYVIVGCLMFMFITAFAVSCITTDFFSTFWLEVIELELFGLAWLVKGKVFAGSYE